MAGQPGTSQGQSVDSGIDQRLQTRNIGETLAGLEECSAFFKLLQDADLVYMLRRSGLHTLFAPRDPLAPRKGTVSEQTAEELERLLEASMLTGAFESFDLRRVKSVKSVEGSMLPVEAENGSFRVGGALIVRFDIPCTNGVIHIMDGPISA